MEIQTIGQIISEFLAKFRIIGIKFFIGLLVFIGFFLIGTILKWIIFFIGRKLKFGKSIFSLFGKIVFSILSIIGVFFALGAVGVNVTAIVASLGLTGFAIGFALRDALSNILAGVLIILYKTFQPGDHIIVTGFEGEITDIDLRYTTIRSDNGKVVIPNSSMFSNPVTILNQNK
ncbi:MAG: mechanosensitive ion channel [Candidatus Gygaella obscura]|nr:mechanosensitive ion channel [Candidatus Gygaella obscura]